MSDGSTGTTAELESTRERTTLDVLTAVSSVVCALVLGLLGFVGAMNLDGTSFPLGLSALGALGALALFGTTFVLFRPFIAADSLKWWGWLAVVAAMSGGSAGLARALGAAWGSERTEGGLVALTALGLLLYGFGNLQEQTGAGRILRALALLTWLTAAGYVVSAIA
jgi:hypothetical protein